MNLTDFDDDFEKPFVMTAESIKTKSTSTHYDPQEQVQGLLPYKRYWKGGCCSLLQFWTCTLMNAVIVHVMIFAALLIAIFVPNIFTAQILEYTFYIYGLTQLVAFVQIIRQAKYYKGNSLYIVMVVSIVFTFPFTYIYIYPVSFVFGLLFSLLPG
ncbi:MAG: hypothetical protein R3Y07_00290 [Eubacteriales bacterium]